MIVVSVARNRQIQQRPDQTYAEAVLPTALSEGTLQALARGEKRLQYLYKQFLAHGAEGQSLGLRRERGSLITLIRAEENDYRDFGFDVVQACGFRTTQAFVDAWREQHRHADRAVVVWFALGDWRDRDRFLNFTGRAGGDYTRNPRRAMDPDAPVPAEITERYASTNRQKDDARRAAASAALAAESPSERLRRIERLIEWLRAEVGEDAARQVAQETRQERRIIRQRIERAERRRKGGVDPEEDLKRRLRGQKGS